MRCTTYGTPLPHLVACPLPHILTHSVASSLAPEDGEIAFNLAAVLEACGLLEESLEQYKKSKEFGVERAAMHMRNVRSLCFLAGIH